jgi:hypothetical protein
LLYALGQEVEVPRDTIRIPVPDLHDMQGSVKTIAEQLAQGLREDRERVDEDEEEAPLGSYRSRLNRAPREQVERAIELVRLHERGLVSNSALDALAGVDIDEEAAALAREERLSVQGKPEPLITKPSRVIEV